MRCVTPAQAQPSLYCIVWARWCHLSAISGVTYLSRSLPSRPVPLPPTTAANEFRSSPLRHVSNPNLNQPNLGVTSSSPRSLHCLSRARVRQYYRTPNFPYPTRHPTTAAPTSVHFASCWGITEVGLAKGREARRAARGGGGRGQRYCSTTLSCFPASSFTVTPAVKLNLEISSDLTLLGVETSRKNLLGSRKEKRRGRIDLDNRNIIRRFKSLRFNHLKNLEAYFFENLIKYLKNTLSRINTH